MKKHENILVFSEGTTVHASQSKTRMPYYPQGLTKIVPKKVTKKSTELTDAFFQGRKGHGEFQRTQTGYPHSILEYSTDQLGLHPTAKPVALMEYLIKTYSAPGEVVLDNTMGSGTTGVASANTGRDFIGMEMDDKYFNLASDRIAVAYSAPISSAELEWL
jgi:site-specific DNA-methyltransferase (adenine-specific)